ncbi:hypothetical protein HanXRQr2_Chr11g0514521 [Helianthus annuus]|uniref:Uncharacterized protein n=1 Tax=Helianthus annuus TaxID=4232 RepID=A0A1Y3BYI2_HELAN|nr:hypothetical protein HanXRQr2_Chr11g0514521 [Helianthus annuus]KAJ0877067.1 hypothetical protein HanPSC8_Chr11g0495841 [Helianthus annuus]
MLEGPGFGPVLKQRLLEQNAAKTEHSSKLPDMARPCQANQHWHSQPALSVSSTTIEDQRSARQCQHQARPC